MASFGKTSRQRLSEIHPDLRKVLEIAIIEFDFTVLCGHRGEAEQNKANDEGKSGLRYPNSKHNKKPSRAVDIAPWPIDWNNIERFEEMKRVVFTAAHALGIELVWGGDWVRLKDCPHFELKG